MISVMLVRSVLALILARDVRIGLSVTIIVEISVVVVSIVAVVIIGETTAVVVSIFWVVGEAVVNRSEKNITSIKVGNLETFVLG